MSEDVRAGGETETPVNPYSLLEAVNNSSDTAHVSWVIFLALMTYLMVAVAGVTHRDLLLETPIDLPILQVKIQQTQFFQFAAIILVMLHVGVIAQLVLVAKKTLEFDRAVQAIEPTDRRTHPLRLELHNFFFVQAVAGPSRSAVMSFFLHAMSWLTLVFLPVILLLYIQISFLPYHSIPITWTHRIALVVDIAMLVLIGIFLTRPETSFFQAFWRTTLRHPVSFVATFVLLLVVGLFSFFIATVPGEALDRMVRTLPGAPVSKSATAGTSRAQSSAMAGFALPFLTSPEDRALFGLFHRNLIVTDTDLSALSVSAQSRPTLTLRGRDLSYAILDRSTLSRADLTDTVLDGASLVGTDLTEARIACVVARELLVSDDRERARCASARGANLSEVKLKDAELTGIDLTRADLKSANLEGADLTFAILTGADFFFANLARADITGGVRLEGANFSVASLQGADFTGAHLQFADFSSAKMQGAVLRHAGLQGGVLRDADLEGADLGQAKLQGADLTGANLKAADLRGASVLMALPPSPTGLALADASTLAIEPLAPEEVAGLAAIIARVKDPQLKSELTEALGPLQREAEARQWIAQADAQRWRAILASATPPVPEAYKAEITAALSQLMCRARWGNGSVASGVGRRAQGTEFRGDLVALYDRLRAGDCPGGQAMSRKVFRELSTKVDVLRGN